MCSLFVVILNSCDEVRKSKFSKIHYKNVGDIAYDKSIDDKNFVICNEELIKQYYVRYSSDFAAAYTGEKPALKSSFVNNYSFPKNEMEDGYVTIQFLVNCYGKSGRFRVQEMNFEYESKKFNPEIKEQLLTITKSLGGWIPVSDGLVDFDFYQYLSFRIEDGQIIKIMP